MQSLLVLGIVALVACDAGKKKASPLPDGPLRVAFGDCSTSDAPFVSGPRPLAPADRVPTRVPNVRVYDGGAGVPAPRNCEGEGCSRSHRSPGLPTTSIGQPTLVGPIDKAVVRRTVKRDLQKIMYCYERTLLAKPDLLGTVTVQFLIAPTGEVKNVSASGVDPDITSCVESVFEAMTFPAGHAGTTVTYPITFRPAGGDATAPAIASDLGSAQAASPPPPPPASGAAHGQMPANPVVSEPGAMSPLRAKRDAIEACVRKAGLASGVFVAGLDFTAAEAKLTIDAADPQLAACLQAIKIVKPPGEAAHERCGVAFGTGGPDRVPVIAINTADISFGGAIVDHVANVVGDDAGDQIAALTEALTAWAKNQPGKVAIRGVGMIEPIDATPMKVVNRALQSTYAAQVELVLARQRGGTWQPLREVVTPVPPIAPGTGGSWNDASHGVKGPEDERVELSVYLTANEIWVGISRVNEFQQIAGRDWPALAKTLREHKASAFFADRNDIELAGDGEVTYGDLLHAFDTAAQAGFGDWRVMAPAELSAKPEL